MAPPRHVAIIMDGNGRWARARGLPRVMGHRRGTDAARAAVRSAAELGIEYLTLYSFSSENWRRPLEEVSELMALLRRYLQSEVADLHANNVRLRVIGDRQRLPNDIVGLIENSEALTRDNRGIQVIMALSYGSRGEITEAVRAIAESVRAGRLRADDITEALVESQLATAGIPDPDLVIRTSGEKRLSNFLLWQAAYAELVFLDTLWPDFTKRDLEDAIREFYRRHRRYGASVG